MPTEAERLARLNVLMQLGRLGDVATDLDRWSADTPRAEAAHTRVRKRLALLKFDFAAARPLAERLLAENPDDVSANQALSLAATLTFDTKCAWAALLKVPYVPSGQGAARLGRPLRNILGQIVNEARLRPEETQVLASAAESSNDEQVRAAAALLRSGSESVCPALALLIGVARAGHRNEPRGSERRRIPRQLHQYWDAEAPPDVEGLMKQASDANPDYAYRRWNDRTARRYLSTLGMRDVFRAYCEANHPAIRADIFRLAVLLGEGGVYLDADDRCTKSIETLLPEDADAVVYQEHTGSIGNNFLAATPSHPLIAAALDQSVRAVLAGAGESTWLATGPGLMSRVVANAIARDPSLRLPSRVHMVPLGEFRDTVQPCRTLQYKLGARHWQRAGLN
jgi:mannosyltransferase OCH1-like enzyme